MFRKVPMIPSRAVAIGLSLIALIVPDSGPSAQPTSAPPACRLTISAGDGGPNWVEATGCDADRIVISASSDGHEREIARHQGDVSMPVRFDPCGFRSPGRPGQVVQYTARVIEGPDKGLVATAQEAFRTKPDSGPPMLTMTTAPGTGAQVIVGQAIDITVAAIDADGGDEEVLGITAITITANGKEIAGNKWSSSDMCDRSRLERTAGATYVVPADAPAEIVVVTTARDSTNEVKATASFKLNAVWDGTLLVKTRQVYTSPNPYWNCQSGFFFPFRIAVLQGGRVSGFGTASVSKRLSCSPNPWPSVNPIASEVDLHVDGTFDGQRFALRFTVTRADGYTGGFGAMWHPGLPQFVVPIAIPGTSAKTDIKISASDKSGVTAEVEGDLSLSIGEPLQGVSP